MKRISPFADPMLQAETMEYNELGCGGCHHNIKSLRGGRKCRENKPEFPDADCHTCKSWQRRAGRDG